MLTIANKDYFLPCFLPLPETLIFLKIKSLNLEERLLTCKGLLWFQKWARWAWSVLSSGLSAAAPGE